MTDNAIIHLIDDDEDVRKAVAFMLGTAGHAVRVYDSATTFLAQLEGLQPGVVVSDVRMPVMDGLELQRRLAARGANLPIIIMTGHADVPLAVEAMKAGAVDFLPKPFRDQDMLDAVMGAIERDRKRRSSDDDAAAVRNRFATLSPRERQVMMLVTAGKMNKQVAGDLELSEITVKIHRGSAMRKMGARTLADLVRMADALKAANE